MQLSLSVSMSFPHAEVWLGTYFLSIVPALGSGWGGSYLLAKKAFVVFTWDLLPGQSLGGFLFESFLGGFLFEPYLPLFQLLMSTFLSNSNVKVI